MPRRGENIYKRKDGRWEGRYIRGRTPAGKAEYGYVYAKSYAACREKRRRMEDALPQKPMLTGEMSVCQAAEFFLSERRGALKASTIGRYEYMIQHYNQAQMAINSNDPLAISNVKFNSATTAASVYRVTVQNPCMGNPYFVDNTNTTENGWTFCNYYISATNVPAASNTAAVSTTLTKNAAATLGGNVSNVSGTTDVTASMNLSVTTPALTVTANGNTRTYVMMVTFASENPGSTISVTFGFDFSELKGTEWYTGDVKTKADQIAAAAATYFGGTSAQPWGTIQVNPNTSAMTVLQQFMQSAGYSEYDPSSTYVASINGLAAFNTTGRDGWMYTNSANGWSTTCNIPNVGAADYTLTDGARITWFYTTNYDIYWH